MILQDTKYSSLRFCPSFAMTSTHLKHTKWWGYTNASHLNEQELGHISTRRGQRLVVPECPSPLSFQHLIQGVSGSLMFSASKVSALFLNILIKTLCDPGDIPIRPLWIWVRKSDKPMWYNECIIYKITKIAIYRWQLFSRNDNYSESNFLILKFDIIKRTSAEILLNIKLKIVKIYNW